MLATAFGSMHSALHSSAAAVTADVLILFAVVLWLGLGFRVHRDARRRIDDGWLVGLSTTLGFALPYIGPVVYLLFRSAETLDDVRSRRVEVEVLEQQLARRQPTCPTCSTSVEPEYLSCPVCTTMLREPCAKCNAPLEPLWQMCPYCATPVELSLADLDAALTGEAQTIALVNDTTSLVPQPEQRAADA